MVYAQDSIKYNRRAANNLDAVKKAFGRSAQTPAAQRFAYNIKAGWEEA
jgi:hypothetical protein